MSLRFTRAMLCATVACGAASPVFAQNAAIVNGTAIPSSRVDAMVQQYEKKGQPAGPELRSAVRDEMINRELLVQEAYREGIPAQPDVQAQVALAQQNAILGAFLQKYLAQHQPSDQQLQAQYQALANSDEAREYHLHHILVESESEALDLIAKLKAGASFDDLAKQYSKDPGSAKNGGDLDWASLSGFVPEFGAAAKGLKKGEITQTPVHTQFGWHIIRLDDVRQAQLPPFEQVKQQIAQHSQQGEIEALLQKLRSQAKIQ